MPSSLKTGQKNLIDKKTVGLTPHCFFLSIEKEKGYFTRQ
jgi:hypothetical protein